MLATAHRSRLLLGALIGLTLGGPPWLVTGCSRCAGGYHAPMPLASGVSGELRGVGFSERGYFVAVGDAGLIAYKDDFDARLVSVRPVSADLYAVTPSAYDGEVIVVGAHGSMLTSTHGGAWTVVDVGTANDLSAVLHVEEASAAHAIAVGDEVIVVRDQDADAWATLPPPGGGWGQLRGLHATAGRIHVVGLAGVVWSTDDPHGTWTREDSGTTEDLLAIGVNNAFDLFAVGANGTLLHADPAGQWSPIQIDVDVDLVDIDHDGVVLAADGRLFRIDDAVTGVEPLFDVGARSHALAFDGSVFVIAGEHGQMSTMLLGTTPQCD